MQNALSACFAHIDETRTNKSAQVLTLEELKKSFTLSWLAVEPMVAAFIGSLV